MAVISCEIPAAKKIPKHCGYQCGHVSYFLAIDFPLVAGAVFF